MSKNSRILIIDCEPDFLRDIQNGLGNHFSLIFANNANEALDMALENKPDAIVLGYLEPTGASFELHLKLRKDKVTGDIPILVVDVRPEEHSQKGWTRQQGKRMKANGYISKPVTPEELKGIIERLVSESSAENGGTSKYLERVLEQIKTIENSLFK